MKDELLYDYFNNSADIEDVKAIEEWLGVDSGHQKEFDDAHAVYNAMAFQEAGFRRESSKTFKKVRFTMLIRAAACSVAVALLFVGTGFLGKYAGESKMRERLASAHNVLEVPAGQSMSIVLDDGTKVFLNGGSRMEYPPVFASDVRSVRLEGEAYLNVTHDGERPFVVETFDSKIEVLGTEFNVYADEENGHFSTTLLRGRVKVSTIGDDDVEQVILSPNEKATRIGNHLVVSKVAADDAVSWVNGYINVGGVSFEELMHRFEDAYNVKIVLTRTDIDGYTSGRIRISEGVEFALRLLQESCDFTYTRDKITGVITIK